MPGISCFESILLLGSRIFDDFPCPRGSGSNLSIPFALGENLHALSAEEPTPGTAIMLTRRIVSLQVEEDTD
jgi:hypothetical protein